MNRRFLYSALLFLFIIIILFPYVRWYADNPDTFQYLEISRKYMSGDFAHAVNGYWSPLISWLLVIPLLITNDGITAFKILQIIIGFFALYNWVRLINLFPIIDFWRNALVIFILPFLADYSLLNLTPDLLFLGLSLFLLRLFLEKNIFTDKSAALKAGITGGLLFLTKAFGFPYFTALLFFIILISPNSKTHLRSKNTLLIGIVFFSISLMWILTLSLKYGHFTISEAVTFNSSIDVAPLPGRGAGLPILEKGITPPSIHAASAWETPGDFVSKETVRPFNNPSQFLLIVKRNFLSIYYFDFRRQAGSIFLLLIVLVLIFKKRQQLRTNYIIYPLLFLALLYGGYSLILVHTRYTWLATMIMVLLSVYFGEILFNNIKYRYITMLVCFTVLMIAVKRPVKEIFYTKDEKVPVNWFYQSLRHPFQTLWIFYRPDMELQQTISDLSSKKILNGNVASLPLKKSERDPYTSAMRIAFSQRQKYFGQLDTNADTSEQFSVLKKNKIDFLIAFQNSSWLDKSPEYENRATGIKIYRVD